MAAFVIALALAGGFAIAFSLILVTVLEWILVDVDESIVDPTDEDEG